MFSDVKKSLDKISCPGMMVFTFRGHGKQGGLTETYRAISKSAKTGEIGDGKIFIARCENAIRIRTGEESQTAI
ncbi:MAG: hypothetical protein AUJ71_04185 [Candidatus Omnitrophica bacterium CG1_02_49_16]|nr:MAG: hypothetical protein AUJ71_04185 [Candidatus Omnitrophica bacterium CG1_02_49_16]